MLNGGGAAFCALNGKHTPVLPEGQDEDPMILTELKGKYGESNPSDP